MMHPALLELRARLEDIGLVVVPNPDYLSVRLPYLCSVQIRYDGGRLACNAFFGVVPRTRATMIKLLGTSALAVTALSVSGLTPVSVMLGFLVAASGTYDVIRTTVTESVITKVQLLWSMHGIGVRACIEDGGTPALSADRAGMMQSESVVDSLPTTATHGDLDPASRSLGRPRFAPPRSG